MIKTNDKIKVYGRTKSSLSEFDETIYEGQADKIDLELEFPIKSQRIENLILENFNYANICVHSVNNQETLSELLRKI